MEFLSTLLVWLNPHPKPVLLIEYPQPLKASVPVRLRLLSFGRLAEILRLAQPYLATLGLKDASILTGPSQLVARTFQSVVYGDPCECSKPN